MFLNGPHAPEPPTTVASFFQYVVCLAYIGAVASCGAIGKLVPKQTINFDINTSTIVEKIACARRNWKSFLDHVVMCRPW